MDTLKSTKLESLRKLLRVMSILFVGSATVLFFLATVPLPLVIALIYSVFNTILLISMPLLIVFFFLYLMGLITEEYVFEEDEEDA